MKPKTLHTTFVTASITREAALSLSAAAHHAAGEHGLHVAVAITDAAGHLKTFEGADGVPFLATEVAIDKAWSAAAFGLGTHVWNEIVRDPKVAQLAHRPRLVTVGGGLPIVRNGQVVGGIGISGASADQDHQVALSALAALGFDAPA